METPVTKQSRAFGRTLPAMKEKHLKLLSYIIVLVLIATQYFPAYNLPSHGDETHYIQEVKYLSDYGVYAALTQGTSVLYSILVLLVSKLCLTDFLHGGRILSVIFLLLSCGILGRCFDRFKGISTTAKYFGIIVFATFCKICIWIALPDTACAFLIFACFRLLSTGPGKNMIWAGIVIFLAAIVKPVALFTIPGFCLYLLLKDRRHIPVSKRLISSAMFVVVFIACFMIYEIPGYMRYHKLMLEDKHHLYNGRERIDNNQTWQELNIYFEAYKSYHNKPNKWAVTFEEVAAFQRKHPEVRLNLSYTQYIATHTGLWLKNTFEKIFLDSTFTPQTPFFFFKYTLINHFIGNYFLMQIISLLVFLVLMWFARDFIRENLLLFLPSVSYILIMCVYVIPQLELNWFLWTTAFLALPIAKLLTDKINIYILLALQTVYILIL